MTKYELKNWLENKHVVGAFYKNNIVENTHDYKKMLLIYIFLKIWKMPAVFYQY